MSIDESRLDRAVEQGREHLDRLLRQPSVAAQGIGIEETAAAVEAMLQGAGFTTERFVLGSYPPMIFGAQPGRSQFTLLLYNHYDVQPAEPLDLWESPPYEPSVRDGKLFARGVSDNKGEIAARLAAIEALREDDGELPITVKWVIEGEEEIGSAHFGEIIEPHAERLSADGGFWEGTGFDDDTGRPTFTMGTKGLLYVQLEIECLGIDAHSGGAAVLPSAAWRLVHALNALKGPDGRVRIPGYYEAALAPSREQSAALKDIPDQEPHLRQAYGVREFIDGLQGEALRERAAFGPTCNIAGVTSGYGGEGIKTVLPARASAKIDFRLVPNQDPDEITRATRAHLDAEGFDDVSLTVLGSSAPVVTPFDDPFARRALEVAQRFTGKPPVVVPLSPGTLPLLQPMRRLVGVSGLMAPTNVAYWGSAAHAPNEHIRLDDFRRGVWSTMELLRGLGDASPSQNRSG